MWAIFKREIQGYFITPIAYVYLTAMAVLSAVYYVMLLFQGSAEIGMEFSFLFTVTLLLTPVLTMRLMSEERKQGTEKLLFSAPVRIVEIILGKYLAACAVYIMGLFFVFLQAASLEKYAPINWSIFFGNLLGLTLTGMACIAICMLVSALTENQIVAAIGGFAVMIFVLLINTLASAIPIEFIRTVLYRFSFYNSYYGFTAGILRLSDLWFFATICVLFVFVTAQVLKRRSVLFSVPVIAVLLILNAIVGEVSDRKGLALDLTENRMYGLSEESAEFLRTLDREVEIHVLAEEESLAAGNTYLLQLYQTLENYDEYDFITVDYVNLTLHPTFVAQYSEYELEENDVIVSCGDRIRILNLYDMLQTETSLNYTSYSSATTIAASEAEQQLTNAVLSVSTDDLITVTVLTGYSDISAESFVNLLENNGFLIEQQSLITEEIDPQAEVAILYGLQSDLGEDILEKLDTWLNNGGKQGKNLLVFADANAGELPNMKLFLQEWGMTLGEGVAVETETGNYYYYPYYPVAEYQEEEYAGGLADSDNPLIMALTSPLGITDTPSGYQVTPLLSLADTAAVMDEEGNLTESEQEIYTMLLSTHTNYGTETNSSSVLLSGSCYAFSSTLLTDQTFSNAEYLLGIMNQLTGREAAIQIAAKDFSSARHSLNVEQIYSRAVIFAAVLPAAILIAGVAVWIIRRRR